MKDLSNVQIDMVFGGLEEGCKYYCNLKDEAGSVIGSFQFVNGTTQEVMQDVFKGFRTAFGFGDYSKKEITGGNSGKKFNFICTKACNPF